MVDSHKKPNQQQTGQKPAQHDEIHEIYQQLLFQHCLAIEGAIIFAKEAFYNNQRLRKAVTDSLKGMHQSFHKFKEQNDKKKIEEILPIIYEQKAVVLEMRQLFNTVYNFNKPEKFEARVVQSREYGHKIKVNFKALDSLNQTILPHVPHLSQKSTTDLLEKQFDHLWRQMLDIVKEDSFDLDTGIEKIKEIVQDIPEAQIRKILVDIKKAKNKNNHNVVKDLLSWEKNQKQKEEEGNKKVELIKKNSKNHELKMIIKAIKDDLQILNQFQNLQAKQFYLTFYNPQKDNDINVENLFQAFCFYFDAICRKTIQDSNHNQNLIINAIDPEDLVSAQLSEIDNFFIEYVDMGKKLLTVEKIVFEEQEQPEEEDPSGESLVQPKTIKLKSTSVIYEKIPEKPIDQKTMKKPSQPPMPPPMIGGGSLLSPTEMVDSEVPFHQDYNKSKQIEEEKTEITVKMHVSQPVSKRYRVRMNVLEDFDEEDEQSVAKRKTLGILKAGQEREFEVNDGQLITFGKDPISDVVIPLDDIDERQFTMTNKNGQVILIDQGVSHPTKIRVQHERGFRLNAGDFIDLGLEQQLFVYEATSDRLPQPTNDKHYDIRYLPKGISRLIDEQLKLMSHLSPNGEKPKLTFEFKGGAENGAFKTFTSDQITNGCLLVGRHTTCDMIINNKLDGVSRKHCRIVYDKDYGWLIYDGTEESESTSGTWVHPKSWNLARVSVKNSLPVQVYNEIIVKVSTFTLQFFVTEIK